MTTTTVKLKFPVTVGGQEYTELHMRRCKVRDRRLAAKEKTDEDREIRLISNLCEVSPDVIDELDAVDYAQLTEVLKGFFDTDTPT
jgi:hypothetical protein